MRASRLFKPLALLAACAALALPCTDALAQPPAYDRVVVFGASLSDTGNAFTWLAEPANAACGTSLNVPPYDALDVFTVPDGPYATGGHHFTNGATWAEGMARALALGGNTRPALANAGQKASNYAVGGARAVRDYPCRYNLPMQVDAYLGDFTQTTPRTLVAIEIGGNDVRDALVAVASTGDPNAAAPYIGGALNSLAFEMVRLYGHGAKRFLLLNVPDVGQTPAVRMLGPVAQFVANQLATQYNANLQGLRDFMALNLQGSDIRILDIRSTLDEVIANPASYGFTNTTEACVTPGVAPFKCKQPERYVFWDGIHPTKAVHAIVAQQALVKIGAP